jgi:hypothetical protein
MVCRAGFEVKIGASDEHRERLSEITCFPTACDVPSVAKSLALPPVSFPIRPLMLQKYAFR